MVGADVENGLWAIYGARQGLYMTMLTDWDFVNVRDFDYLNNMWKNLELTVNEETLIEAIEDYGDKLKAELDLPISITPLDAGGSLFFKTVYQNPARTAQQQFIDREN
jgi:hypothetical protein